MPERKSFFERVLIMTGGQKIDKEKQKELNDLKDGLEEGELFLAVKEYEELRKFEKENTEEDLEIINLLDRETNKLLRNLYLPEFSVRANAISIINTKEAGDLYPKPEGRTVAFFLPLEQRIIMPDDMAKNKIAFAAYLLHEILHLKSFGSLEIKLGKEQGQYSFGSRRSGLKMAEKPGSKLGQFVNLDEAITTVLTKEIFPNLMKETILNEEVERMTRDKKIVTEKEEPRELYVKDEEGEGWKSLFGRRRERQILDDLMVKIFERNQRNQNQFKSKVEVFHEFVKAKFSGNIIPIAKLVDETFGQGTFRKLGESDNIPNQVDELEKIVQAF